MRPRSPSYHDGVEVASAFILAGGRSSRMGTDKALLRFGDKNLLQVAIGKAKAVSSSPVIVGDRQRYCGYGAVVEDVFPGSGPLGGIQAALCTTQTDLNLILSVDTPLITAEFLLWLVQTAAAGSELAFVPECGGRTQPLCAVYRRAAFPVIERNLKAGEFKVDRIFGQFPTRLIPESELGSAGFGPEMFANINTPEEYAAAIRQASRTPLGQRR